MSALFEPGNDAALQKEGESIYLDRNSKTFQALIDFLRNDRKELPVFADEGEERAFQAELEYWQIDTDDPELEEKRLRSKMNPELIEYLDQEPKKAAEKAKLKWSELGPFKLFAMVDNIADNEL